MHDMWFWIAATVAAICVGMSKGGLPVIGNLSVPIMALVMSPLMAAGLLLPVYVISDMFGLWAYRRAFDARVLWIVLPGAVFGIGIGWATASIVPEASVTLVIGLIGVAFALNLLLRRQVEGPPREPKVAPGLFWGAVAGFTSFVSHAGAPPYQVYTLPLRLPKAVFAGTSTIAFAVINAVKLIPYYDLGQINMANLQAAAVLAIPASLAVFVGVRLVRRLPEKAFFRLVSWALLLVSLKLIYDGLTHLV